MIVQLFHVDVGERKLMDVSNVPAGVEKVRLVTGDTRAILVFKFKTWDGSTWTAFPITPSATMAFAIKQGTVRAAVVNLVFSDAAAWNVSGDYASIDRATGIMSVRVNLNTTELKALYATSDAYKDLVGEIVMIDGGVNSTLCQFDVRVYQEIYRGDEGTPAPAGPTYYTAAQIDAILAGLLNIASGKRLKIDSGSVISVETITP